MNHPMPRFAIYLPSVTAAARAWHTMAARSALRKRLSLAAPIGALAMCLSSAFGEVTASKELPDGGQFTVDGGTLRIQFWSQDVVRVTFAAAAAELPTIKSLSVIASPAAVPLTRQENDRAFTLYEDEGDS